MVLNRVLDDPTFATINSLIFFNNVEIVTQLQNDPKLIGDLYDLTCLHFMNTTNSLYRFTKLKSDTTPTQRKDTLLFIHEMCNLAKNLQVPNRMQLYKYVFLSFNSIPCSNFIKKNTYRTRTIWRYYNRTIRRKRRHSYGLVRLPFL